MIAASLKADRRFILWKAFPNGDHKPIKKPLSRSGYPIDRHNAAHYLTYDDARSTCVARPDLFDGVGYVIYQNGLVGVDLDHCRDAITGEIADWARAVIAELNSYTEVSPSGKGVHIILRGAIPPTGRKKNGHEIYDDQYFTFTERHVEGTPTDVQSRPAEIAALHARIFGGARASIVPAARPDYIKEGDTRGTENIPEPIELTDDDVIARASNAANGDKFRRLYSGDWSGYGSQSEADKALCHLLAFWTMADPARVDALFRRSGLFRAKWDERRGRLTYGQRTVAKVLATTTEFYVPIDVVPDETDDLPVIEADDDELEFIS